MDGAPTGSVHKKRHSIFGRLKTVLTGRSRDKDTRLIIPGPSSSNTTANPDAPSSTVDPNNGLSRSDDHDARDHWQMAYDELTESDQNTLATLLLTTPTKLPDAGRSRTKEILDQVVRATETRYKEDQTRQIRETAHRILNSALSFQDVVSNAVKFDPTGYASSAWAIVSLGLTMAKNYVDLRDALFDSSAYLADLLARCAFIEEQFYRGGGPVVTNAEKRQSVVRVYVAILRYSAEVRRAQQFDKGKDVVESITAATSQHLAQLKTSIKEEESHLHRWLLLDQHLHRKAEAESILTHIDELLLELKKVKESVTMLNLPFAKGAFFDSYADQREAECLPGTRTELLREVKDWAKSSKRCIFWLSGMAGTGKSAIARTVARSFEEDGILGASFFFRRGEADRGSAAKFFPTIVKQLAVHIPQMLPGIQNAIESDPAIPERSLREQFNQLMLRPLLAVDHDRMVTPTVIVVDALDECEREEDVEIILELLPKVEKATGMVIRFFLTSRPESPIRFGFDQIGESGYENTILQNLDDNMIKHDITLYLRDEFSKIRWKRRRDLPPGWPGEERIEALATTAVPLFIFAATMCRFVADKHFDPEERLREFSTNSTGSKMDDTYRPVLNQLLVKDEKDRDKLIEEFQKIIGVIITLASPLSLSSLAELLETPEHQISIRLDLFHSVLTIPGDPKLPIRTLHLSFHDYLVDERTKAQQATCRFWVDKKKKHEFIAKQCLTVMGRRLRKNICELPTHGTSRTEIDSACIARFLPPALQYSCRYWVYHLDQSSTPGRTLDQVFVFLKEHFLHWLESMGILGIISESLNAVDTLLKLTKDTPNTAVSLFLSDARRFILKFINIVDATPLQLYTSCLIFAPRKALIRRNFERELPDWLSRGPRVEENWSAELQTLEGHSDSVSSVAFLRDGQLLASGSDDKTIKLWDPATGALKHTLEGHSDAVGSVAFSPDGQLLASGSDDKTIKLWDPATGALRHILEGHSDAVGSVAFSPDGQLLASGSGDATIKLWDPATGALKHTLEGHFGPVRSVTFSPDGQLLASGSDDNTIKLWDPAIGALRHTLEGHSDAVGSVAFSPDGQLLASGSHDGTVKLWNPATGILKHTLEGHSGWVVSIAFSRDGQILASGSHDDTINLWDPVTGALNDALVGHSSLVLSVAFSPDGQLLASGSYDRTIKLWEPATGAVKHTMDGHSRPVQLVSFSQNGHILASGSNDDTIKLWDPVTGTLKHTLKGHSGSVWSVTFSQDGQLLASSSSDGTIKLWDPATGALKHTLKGHSGPVGSVVFSQDGQCLASSSSDGTIKLWDPTTGALKHTLESHSGLVLSVTFSQDGQLLASGSSNNTIKLWDPAIGVLKHTLEGHLGWVWSVAFSKDGQLLASSSSDSTIKLWDPAIGALKNTLEGHSDWVQSIVFSPDGQLLASGSRNGTIKLWDSATSALKHTISIDGSVRNIEFSKYLPQLNTNLGTFNIQVCYKRFCSHPSGVVTEAYLQGGRWVTFQGQKELWLPPDYQPNCSTSKDGTIALGCADGRAVIIAISTIGIKG